MSTSSHPKIRELLHKHDDGLTVTEISEKTKVKLDTVFRALKDMPDTYIDRWVYVRGQYAGVWCIVVPPEDCPKPTED
jgi:hypothetical protein